MVSGLIASRHDQVPRPTLRLDHGPRLPASSEGEGPGQTTREPSVPATLPHPVQAVSLLPRVHLFVCTNHRDPASPLGSGCAGAGDAVYDTLKAAIARQGEVRSAWVTKTHCLGVCPKHGATVAAYPNRQIWAEVVPSDAPALLSQAGSAAQAAWDDVETLLGTMQAHHVAKVFELARRLKPGVTKEDMRNPHDFPELADTDWHFEDGVLSGVESVLSAVRARRREHT